MEETPSDVTRMLLAWSAGRPGAEDSLFPLVYEELKGIARRYLRHEREGHTLQPTALVHEAYLRLVDQTRVTWQNRAQFYGVAATMMRRILVNHARARATETRG
jgi:RNA polymerase sigma factor (TIGR02999 family)